MFGQNLNTSLVFALVHNVTDGRERLRVFHPARWFKAVQSVSALGAVAFFLLKWSEIFLEPSVHFDF
jgi:hypothetical protein